MSHLNQTVVITGASSGIGAEIAKKFAAEGYGLLLFGRNEEKLKKVQAECSNTKAEIVAFNLLQLSQHKDMIQKKLNELAAPTILINNAALFQQGLLEETTDDAWETQFQTNLLSAVKLTKFFWPIFKKNNKGSVLNISSTLGIKPTANTGAYSALKAALNNWTLSLAQEGGKYNIRANCVCPGIIDTPMHSFHFLAPEKKKETLRQISQLQLLAEIGKAKDIAEAAYFLASDLSKWTTGAILNVDGGINIK